MEQLPLDDHAPHPFNIFSDFQPGAVCWNLVVSVALQPALFQRPGVCPWLSGLPHQWLDAWTFPVIAPSSSTSGIHHWPGKRGSHPSPFLILYLPHLLRLNSRRPPGPKSEPCSLDASKVRPLVPSFASGNHSWPKSWQNWRGDDGLCWSRSKLPDTCLHASGHHVIGSLTHCMAHPGQHTIPYKPLRCKLLRSIHVDPHHWDFAWNGYGQICLQQLGPHVEHCEIGVAMRTMLAGGPGQETYPIETCMMCHFFSCGAHRFV